MTNAQDRSPEDRTPEDRSKDDFFTRTAALADAMIAAHGREFTMGTLILAARFIAEGKPLVRQPAAPAGPKS